MRRLLVTIVTISAAATLLCSRGNAVAAASGRVPPGVNRIVVSLTFLPGHDGHSGSFERTLARRAAVRRVVQAADRLKPAVIRGACPQLMRLGPELSIVFRGGRRDQVVLAQARVQIALGTHGDSGASACFPIGFSSGRTHEPLVGNSFVRLIGRLIGRAIS